MYCHNCGRRLSTEKFCPGCGARVVQAPPPAQEASAASGQKKQKAKKASGSGGKKVWILLIAILLIIAMIGAALYFFVFRDRDTGTNTGGGDDSEKDKEEKISPFELDVSSHSIVIGEDDGTILFYAVLAEEADQVTLYDKTTNTKITDMLDDGEGSDEVAGDLIYTASVVLPAEEAGSTQFIARTANNHSDIEIVSVLAPFAEQELNDIAAVDQAVDELQSESFYELSYEDRLTTAQNTLQTLADNGLIEADSIYHDEVNQTVTFYYTSGIIGLIDLKERIIPINPLELEGTGTSASSDVEQVAAGNVLVQDDTEGVDVKLLYAWFDSGETGYTETLQSLQNIENICSAYGYNVTLDSDVTLEDLKNLSEDELVNINAHGTYTTFKYKTNERYFFFFRKTEKVTTSGFALLEQATTQKDKQYSADLKSGRLIKSGSHYIVLPAFFDEYYNRRDLIDTMFLFGSCQLMGANGTIHRDWADVLLSKSAKAMVAFHNSVYIFYGYDLFDAMIDELADGRTISEALETARAVHGTDDVVWGNAQNFANVHSPAAYPILSGDEDARLVSIIGSIRGKVADAVSREALSGVSVTLHNAGESDVLMSTTTDENGNFSFTLEEGLYDLLVSAPDYLNCSITDTVVEKGYTNYLENTILLNKVEGDPLAMISGTVTNAVTDEPVSGAVIRFRENWGNRTGDYVRADGSEVVLTTADDGTYYTEALPYGYYTIEISRDEFSTQYVNVIAASDPQAYENQNIVLVPVAYGNDFRITLEWDANPRDEDSHIVSDSPMQYHVYYANSSYYSDGTLYANLDHDDTQGNGFETITLTVDPEGTYYYYVHHYAGSGSLSTSNAIVKVYQGDVMIRQYNVPVDQGTGIYWNVFNIVDGRVVTINRISDTPSG